MGRHPFLEKVAHGRFLRNSPFGLVLKLCLQNRDLTSVRCSTAEAPPRDQHAQTPARCRYPSAIRLTRPCKTSTLSHHHFGPLWNLAAFARAAVSAAGARLRFGPHASIRRLRLGSE